MVGEVPTGQLSPQHEKWTEAELKDMIERCNKAKVRIYVDMVTNHMTGGQSGVGTDKSHNNGDKMTYPEFSAADFKWQGQVPSGWFRNPMTMIIPKKTRNCRLGGLRDLNQGSEYVRQNR